MEKLAVVIGAGGLGAAIARKLTEGRRLLLADVNIEGAAAVARELGGQVEPVQCDVTSPADVQSLADAVAVRGGLDTLVHVAGLSPVAGDFDQIVRVNLVGPALVARALLPHVKPGAAAVMIASLAANLGGIPAGVVPALREHAGANDLPTRLRGLLEPGHDDANTAYRLSKYGLLMLCRRLATAWAESGARIVSLSPGLIATPMGARETATNPAKRKLAEAFPAGREGRGEEIVDVVEFLVSAQASFISGTDILVDGGLAGTLCDLPFGLPGDA